MLAEYKYTLRKLRGVILGWGIGLFLYDAMMSSFYSSIKEIGSQMEELLNSYPPELLAFFPSIKDFASPIGYFDTYFSSYMPIILGIFATALCAKLIVGDEEKGTLDLVVSYPISRTSMFWSRFLAFVTATLLILFACWIGWVLPAENAGLALSMGEFALPFIPLFGIILLFGSLSLLFSLILPSARLASGLASAIVITNFLLIGMGGMNETLQKIYELSPLYFHQGGKAIENLEWVNVIGFISVAVLFTLFAWWRFEKRDIRVGGEAGWKLPLPNFLRKKA